MVLPTQEGGDRRRRRSTRRENYLNRSQLHRAVELPDGYGRLLMMMMMMMMMVVVVVVMMMVMTKERPETFWCFCALIMRRRRTCFLPRL